MEIFIGLLIVGGVFALIVWFVIWYVKKANARYAQLWSQLAPMVSGAHKGNKLEGAYQGRTVYARLDSVSDGDEGTDYYFELRMATVPRGRDWKVAYGGEKLLGFGEKRWHVATKDDALKERLNGSGVVAAMSQWGAYPTISFRAKNGELEYRERVRNAFDLPAPPRFQQQLELLAHFSQVNEQVNAA